MASNKPKFVRFGAAIVMIVLPLAYLAVTAATDKDIASYYVTIQELQKMDQAKYTKRLRVAGNVTAGSIKREGGRTQFTLEEEGRVLPVEYTGIETLPDTFKDKSQALAEGKFGRDGVFHAQKIQAKCASKYAPKQDAAPAGETPAKATQKAQASTPAM